MKLSPEIDLGRSLRQVFGNKADFTAQIQQDCERQSDTTSAILRRFFGAKESERRELTILADEVGLGKTYVALAVAVSILDAIRQGEAPDGLPSNRPAVLVLTPTNDALFNKWVREAEGFKKDCARHDSGLEWLQIHCPIDNGGKSGNVINLSEKMRDATRSQPVLLIAKLGVLGAALHDRDLWRERGLAALFGHFRTPTEKRRFWCRKGRVFENFGIPELDELLDLRGSGHLWDDSDSPDLQQAFSRALQVHSELADRSATALSGTDEDKLSEVLDDLARFALVTDWPLLPLVVIDEIHGLKNERVQARRHFEAFLSGKICRLLGLSATPFQLRHDELLSLLKLQHTLALPRERFEFLDEAKSSLGGAMKDARESGEEFRRRWKGLRPVDRDVVSEAWNAVQNAEGSERKVLADLIRPPRIMHAINAALDLEQRNSELRQHLQPFVIRHQHPRVYRENFVGNQASLTGGHGSPTFNWSPGIEVRGDNELPQYLMMRAIALAKEERGLPSLGAELTGSYRHLVETAAVWTKLAQVGNPLLREYRGILEEMIGKKTPAHDPDAEHRKVQTTVHRALEFFKRGQKSLVFCVYTKTAETVRDHLRTAIDTYLAETRGRVFGDAAAFENFRRRFFNRREALFSLIQDHPLLSEPRGGRVGVPTQVALAVDHLRQIGTLMVAQGEFAESDKPDRRLLIAATEHVAVKSWRDDPEGAKWLAVVLRNCPDLEDRIADPIWLEAREPLSRSERAGRVRRASDPEAAEHASDPLEAEESDRDVQTGPSEGSVEAAVEAWVRRLRTDAIGEVVAPYFRRGLIAASGGRQPLLAAYHGRLLAELDLETRAIAGQVFRRILMADEFLLRYLADVEKDQVERWADYLSERYVRPLAGDLESLCDRFHAYLETLEPLAKFSDVVEKKQNGLILFGERAPRS